jgi:hypothetical protein
VENLIQAHYLAIMSSNCLHLKKKNFPRDMKQKYVFLKLANYNFDLWMSKGTHDVFALVITLLGVN